MKFRKCSIWVLVYIFILYSIFTTSIVEGAVLCIGDDGHVAVEMVCECGTQPFPENQGASLSASSISCVDIPLLNAPFSVSSAKLISGGASQSSPLVSPPAASPDLVILERNSTPSSDDFRYHATPVSIFSILRI